MKIEGNYWGNGYALVRDLVPPEVGHAFIRQMRSDLRGSGGSMQQRAVSQPLTAKPTIEVYGYNYRPMLMFLWGLTPTICGLVGRDLLPTYNYFRIYRQGDTCRVHSDRPACEHSLSLTLAYSDSSVWDLEIGEERIETSNGRATDDWGEDGYAGLRMQAGDAVLYQGVHHNHGRTMPNPNGWSAHLFLHWVERGGPFEKCAFDVEPDLAKPLNIPVEAL